MKKRNKIFYGAIIIFIALISILLINYIVSPKKGELKEISYNEIKKKTENKDDFILVVSKSTCSHCATYKPKVEKIAEDYGITIYFINYDNEKEETQKEFLKEFNLDGSTPITMFIENGKETSILNRLEGDLSSSKVIEKIKEMGFIKK